MVRSLGLGLTSTVADRLEELAAALDAGLSAELALASARFVGDPRDGIVPALRMARVGLTAAELDLLAACEDAGRLAPALRTLAGSRRARVVRERRLLGAFAYPGLLIAFALLLCLTVVPRGSLLATVALGLIGAAVLATAFAIWALRRARRDPTWDPRTWPILGMLSADASEVPYLEAMAALHGAGVKLADAHRLATRTVPFAAARAHLLVAGHALDAGESLATSLSRNRAVGAESQELLAQAEPIGNLEDAFTRAGARRREVFERRMNRTGKALGGIAYLGAAVLVGAVALTFYGGLFSRI